MLDKKLDAKPGDLEMNGVRPPVKAVSAASGASAQTKLMCLTALALQTTLMVILTRFSRVGDRKMYIIFSMVCMTEFFKLCLSCLFLSVEMNSLPRALSAIKNQATFESKECLKLLVPAGLYFFQNNILIYAITNLDAAMYQVCYQSKLIVTAVLSVIMLNRKLSPAQWSALLMLTLGIVMVNLSNAQESKQAKGQQQYLGLIAVSCAAVSSGLAGVYFEKLVKGGKQSVWMRNIFLAFFSLLFGALTAMTQGRAEIQEKGFFYGFDRVVWCVVCVNSAGGMVVALVIKYADNILKGFATGISALLSTVVSVQLFGFMPNMSFMLGAIVVIFATFVYSNAKKIPLWKNCADI